jgi:hypothetical protein
MTIDEGSDRIIFAGTVDAKGHVVPEQVNVTRGRLARWNGRKVTVTVTRYIKSKSNPQLALYFGPVVAAWSDYTGYDLREMHHELKRAYLPLHAVVSRLTGEERQELPSLADLNSEEMSAYLDRVIREGRQVGIEFSLDPASG